MSILQRAFNFFSRSNHFSTPPETRIYAIGDIHGYPDVLKDMLENIHTHIKANPIANPVIVFLGDYGDRGPNTRGVLDLVVREKELKSKDNIERIFLAGNHDVVLSILVNGPPLGGIIDPLLKAALDHGLLETMLSYGVECELTKMMGLDAHRFAFPSNLRIAPAALKTAQALLCSVMPDPHKEFLKQMEISFRSGDYLFVHAGIDPEKPIDQQDASYMTGVRSRSRQFPECREFLGVRVVRGHTVREQPLEIFNQIGIDTGVFMHGNLTCAILEGKSVAFIQARTKLPLYDQQRTLEFLGGNAREFAPSCPFAT